jgi:hypothetical protein
MNNKKLHERIIAGIVLVTISLAVYAAEHGAESGTGTSYSDSASACSSAKRDADGSVTLKHYGATITGHSSCDCSSSKTSYSTSWTCTVDAYWEKK